jgi:hypothetical protein
LAAGNRGAARQAEHVLEAAADPGAAVGAAGDDGSLPPTPTTVPEITYCIPPLLSAVPLAVPPETMLWVPPE